MTDNELRETLEKIRKAKLCVLQPAGATFVLEDDSHLEIGGWDAIAILCMLHTVEMINE